MPAFACAFDRIGHEVEQNLFKPCRIATYGIVLHFGAQRHPLVLKYIFTLGAVAICHGIQSRQGFNRIPRPRERRGNCAVELIEGFNGRRPP